MGSGEDWSRWTIDIKPIESRASVSWLQHLLVNIQLRKSQHCQGKVINMMGGARHVFRCFKGVERIGDRITGAAGPYFVGLAVILISLGTLNFCKYTSSRSSSHA